MNVDSVNDRELFSLLHPDIYRSFLDDGVYESTAPLLELPISPNTNLAESSPRPQNDPWYSDSTVAAPRTITCLCSLLSTFCSFNLYVTWYIMS